MQELLYITKTHILYSVDARKHYYICGFNSVIRGKDIQMGYLYDDLIYIIQK